MRIISGVRRIVFVALNPNRCIARPLDKLEGASMKRLGRNSWSELSSNSSRLLFPPLNSFPLACDELLHLQSQLLELSSNSIDCR